MSDEPIATDPVALERLRAIGGSSLVSRMVDAFLLAATERMSAARAGAQRGDHDAVRRAAHALKGSAAQLGALALAATSDETERAALAGDARRVQDAVARLERDLAAVRPWLESQLIGRA